MDQRRIFDLLHEAMILPPTDHRLSEIRAILVDAVVIEEDAPADIQGQEKGFKELCESLFRQAAEKKPVALLSLFPFFAAVCGERKQDGQIQFTLAEVDWSFT